MVIGAGVNGLSLALRLQRAGLQTLVAEKERCVGGMARTEEPLLPGFRHNPHANYLGYGAVSPLERQFDLARGGLSTVTPDAQHGLSFQDGRPPLVIYRNGLTERSVASLKSYSARDARTYKALKKAANALDSQIEASLYAPPAHHSALRLMEAGQRSFKEHGGDLHRQSAREVIDSLFESDEVRTLFYQLSAETGLSLEAPDSGVGFLTFTLWAVGQWRLPIGGMQAYPNALAELARQEGVVIALNTRVERVVLKSGRATGVAIAGQGEVRARRAVASSAGLCATLGGMLPPGSLSDAESASLAAYAATEGPTLGTLVFCLNELPDYRSARWNPDINRCFRTVIGYENARSTLSHLREVDGGLLPSPAAALRANSLWDPSQAPSGFHVVGGDVLMPSTRSLSVADWDAVGLTYADAFQDVWMRYAPNVTMGAVLASRFFEPRPYERTLRLGVGTGQYRTEVEQLYLCGASTSPGGGAHGACGYNAFEAIAEDLKLPGKH